jgi:hypothetical protein
MALADLPVLIPGPELGSRRDTRAVAARKLRPAAGNVKVADQTHGKNQRSAQRVLTTILTRRVYVVRYSYHWQTLRWMRSQEP